MKRRDFLKAAGGVLLSAQLCRVQGSSIGCSRKPNVILCMADDQGWGDMGYNGHPFLKTPNFDAMAAEGLRFDRFYAAAPVCSPTRGSVLTGRHPNRFGCLSWGHTLRPQEVTLAEALKAHGYVTGHFGKWHLGSVFKNSPVNPGASGFDEWISSPNFYENDPIFSVQGTAKAFKGEGSIVTVDLALDFIRRHSGSEQPFLAVIWFGSPHGPHAALPEYRAFYNDQTEQLQNFYGEITAMDHAVGKLRESLKTLGIHDNTLLWYCSDNGGLRGSGVTGGREYKASIYEGGLRVPAILQWPARIPDPRTTAVPCTTSDIFPTLMSLAEAQPSPRVPLDGISLVPVIDGRMSERTEPIGFWKYPVRGGRTESAELMLQLLNVQKAGKEIEDPGLLYQDAGRIDTQYPDDTFPGHAAWLDWPWKLHRLQTDRAVRLELYHLGNDPQESDNVAQQHAARTTAMKAQLERWLASVVASLNGEDYAAQKPGTVTDLKDKKV